MYPFRTVTGRSQEWNISRHEIEALVHEGLLTSAELEACVTSEFNPIRSGFHGMSSADEIWESDLLNLGICPRALLQILKDRFLDAGGVLLEETSFRQAEVFDDGIRLRITPSASGPVSHKRVFLSPLIPLFLMQSVPDAL
jgi:lycopene cyclase CruP